MVEIVWQLGKKKTHKATNINNIYNELYTNSYFLCYKQTSNKC